MGSVEGGFIKPAWNLRIILALVEPGPERVVVSAILPHFAADASVGSEGGFAAAPHFDSGMILPAIIWRGQRKQDLLRLHALFAQPRAIEAREGLGEVRIREECLHGGLPEEVEDVVGLEAEFLREDFFGVFAFEDALAGVCDCFVSLAASHAISAHEDLFEGFFHD